MTVTVTNGLLKARGAWAETAPTTEAQRLLILNLMPTKLSTERQFLQRLAAGDTDVEVTFMYPTSHRFKSLPRQVVAEHYVTLADVADQYFDGLIITGAPVETIDFEAVDYWQEFLTITDWAQTHVGQTLYECWAAQAGLYAQFGIQKQRVGHKVFGIYAATATDVQSPLISGLSAGGLLKMPQSRHTELVLPASSPAGLQVVAENSEVGPLILTAPEQHAVYVTGHPEYEQQTLADEYFRDQRKHLPIQLPEHYFADSQLTTVDYSWRTASNRFYQNWLATLSLTKVGY